MSKKKPLIVFEGVEGSGKTTLINHISNILKKKKIKFVKIREPGGSKNSELIRKLILRKNNDFNSFTDLFLYLAARSENIEKIIRKNYNKRIILLDRFIDSTIAYQHYGMNLNKNLIEIINKLLLVNIKPHLIFLNIVSMKNLSLRLKNRKNKNRYDRFNIKFYNRVQNGFIKISKNKKNYIIIDSNKDINNNKKLVLNNILNLIK